MAEDTTPSRTSDESRDAVDINAPMTVRHTVKDPRKRKPMGMLDSIYMEAVNVLLVRKEGRRKMQRAYNALGLVERSLSVEWQT